MRHSALHLAPSVGRPFRRLLFCLPFLLLPPWSACGQAIVTVLDATGDGAGNLLDEPTGTAVDADGNLFVGGFTSRNVFQITPGGTVTEIVDSTGDGTNALRRSASVATDSDGNVYVSAEGNGFGQAFRIATPGTCATDGKPCMITQIIDSSGDGANGLNRARAIAIDAAGNVYVAGFGSDNVFRIATPGGCSTGVGPCTITEILDSTGDGVHGFDGAYDLATDSSGNVYAVGIGTDNVFKISTPGACSTGGTPCTITQIIDDQGDGAGNLLDSPINVAVDGADNVYVTAQNTNNAFRIENPTSCSTSGPPCPITEIVDVTGDGMGNGLSGAWGVAADPVGDVFVGGRFSSNVFHVGQPGGCSTSGSPCAISEVIDITGDGMGNGLSYPFHLVAYGIGHVFVPGRDSDTVFSVQFLRQGLIFKDGFESEGVAAWRATVP